MEEETLSNIIWDMYFDVKGKAIFLSIAAASGQHAVAAATV